MAAGESGHGREVVGLESVTESEHQPDTGNGRYRRSGKENHGWPNVVDFREGRVKRGGADIATLGQIRIATLPPAFLSNLPTLHGP